MANKITVPVLFGEKEKLFTITVSPEEYEGIMNGDQEILQNLVTKEMEKRSTATIQHLVNSNDQDLKSSETVVSLESDAKENKDVSLENDAKKNKDEKETFTWPEKAVMLCLELYREREHEFTAGLKRHNKLWAEIVSELRNYNYNVSAVQVQNKLSSLKRTYKKSKDSNAKSGNHNSCWAYYSIMNSLFGEKSWVSPVAVASSDGPIAPSALASSSSSICHSSSPSPIDKFEYQDSSSKPKKRKVKTILDSFVSDIQRNRDQMKEERREQRLEKEKRKEQRWEASRAEKKEMHNETSEIQRSLVSLLGKLIEKQNESK
ncbi:hypothetical protein DMN91_004308 [Ooceraea biroi]|uniref:Myb/SANT-like DNA-binding domain-containing protein n=1 Tax=Ooceraea biroi TaxID=2015173 RepID=A0A026W3E1_OOCBI|nr:uncharacterized protein LOC105283523 [Ooceraea biroi]EZA50548.1 hypothetical protein X777_10899 [Ooceraea biroi]RLU24099.1 hypothetical protein DMN91_004308 [Ooceraea biroi]